MKKTYSLILLKKTRNYLVYSCPAINGLYLSKMVFPNRVPGEMRVTLEVLQGIE
ncbi:MAG: hypothetical protein KAJ44_01075 [Thermoplasmatales archaeon]|nr:hypothetical protein [Thermoplasmatales archaeon]